MTWTPRRWPRVLIGLGTLAGLVWWHGTDAFTAALSVIDGRSVLAALGIGLLTTLFSALRWRIVACRLSLRLPLPTAIADYYRSQFLNAVLPAGVLGDAHRAVSHGRRVGDVGRGARAVVLERVAGQAILVLAAVAVLATRPAVAHVLVPGRGSAVAVLSVIGVLGAVFLWLRGTSRRRHSVAAAWAEARRGLLSRHAWPGVAVLSVAALAGHVALFIVAARLAGSSGSILQLVPLIIAALLAMGLPVNIGGWGPREAVAAMAFGAAGMGAAQGLTAAVTYGVLTLVAALPGAGVLVLGVQDRQQLRERRDQVGEEVLALTRRGQ